MFTKLFAQSGLSLDRLKTLLEVGVAGSFAKAAAGDPVRQSQFSRQVKELEDFFQTRLVERQGRGIHLTPAGKELARISRFFLLGLSNFQRGCLTEEQTYRLGANATFIEEFLIDLVSAPATSQPRVRYQLEVVSDDEVERRLHDLTLDFGVVMRESVSRPLKLEKVAEWQIQLWVPKKLHEEPRAAVRAFKANALPFVVAATELPEPTLVILADSEPHLTCPSFIQAKATTVKRNMAVFLPDFLAPQGNPDEWFKLRVPGVSPIRATCSLAWNPRLLRLNPHAARRRDWLLRTLKRVPRLH